MGKRNNNTLKLVTAAILAALSFVLMYIGSLSGIFDLCAVTLGAVGVVFAVIELGGVYPWLISAVVSVLCFIFLPDKFSALEYIVIAGIYPILKSKIERLNKLVSYLVKIVYFNVLLTGCIYIAKFVFSMVDDWLTPGLVLYLLANIFFLLFDTALTAFVSAYVLKIKPRLKIKF